MIKQIRRMINQGSHAYTISIYYRTSNRNERRTHIRTYTLTFIFSHRQINTRFFLHVITESRNIELSWYDNTFLVRSCSRPRNLELSSIQCCRSCCRQMERDFPSSSCFFSCPLLHFFFFSSYISPSLDLYSNFYMRFIFGLLLFSST